MSTAGGHKKNASLANGIFLATGHEPTFAALIIEDLMVRMLVGIATVGDGDVLIPLHTPQVQDRMAEPIIDLNAQNLLPSFGS